MRVVHFSGNALSYGIEEKKLEGILCEYLVLQRLSPIVSNTATR